MEYRNYRKMGISPTAVTHVRMTAEARPEDIEVGLNMAQRQVTVAANVEAQEDGGYGYDAVTLPTGTWGYGSIVSALFRVRYSADEVEAIVNNNIALMATPTAIDDEDGRQKLSEFERMQAYREACKTRARELIEMGREMGLAATSED